MQPERERQSSRRPRSSSAARSLCQWNPDWQGPGAGPRVAWVPFCFSSLAAVFIYLEIIGVLRREMLCTLGCNQGGGGSGGPGRGFLTLSQLPKVNWKGALPAGRGTARPSAGGTNSGPLGPRLLSSSTRFSILLCAESHTDSCGKPWMSPFRGMRVERGESEHRASIVPCTSLWSTCWDV